MKAANQHVERMCSRDQANVPSDVTIPFLVNFEIGWVMASTLGRFKVLR
jgi:hypothetical protein